MRRLVKFVRLSASERPLLAEAAVVLGLIRLGLWLLPLRHLTSLIARATRRISHRCEVDASFAERATRAVSRASTTIPGATCLIQALAVQALLQRRGLSAELRIGLTRGSRARVDGHAWVECDGAVIFRGGFIPQIVLPLVERDRRHVQ